MRTDRELLTMWQRGYDTANAENRLKLRVMFAFLFLHSIVIMGLALQVNHAL